MDGARFDTLARTYARTPSRRGILRLLGGGVLTAWVVPARSAAAATCRLPGRPCVNGEQCCSGRCSKSRQVCLSTCQGKGTICERTDSACGNSQFQPFCTCSTRLNGGSICGQGPQCFIEPKDFCASDAECVTLTGFKGAACVSDACKCRGGRFTGCVFPCGAGGIG